MVTVRERLSASGREAGTPAVELYDFLRPVTLGRDQSRLLELVFETFARQWGTQLTAKVRTVSRVTYLSSGLPSYDEYVATLPETSAMVLIAMEGVEARAILQFPTNAALRWIGRMLGGSGRIEPRQRSFTQIEQALVRRLAEDALEDLRYSMGTLLPMAMTVEAFHYNPQFAQAAATTDLMVVGSFELEIGEHTSPATLALPAEAVLPQLGIVEVAQSSAEARDHLGAHLIAAPLELSLRFDPTPVSPSVVLGLAEGDVIPLVHPQHRPLQLTVDGELVARAAVGSNGNRLACVVLDPQEAS
jgi:flagellar motor switch protein FliM